MDEVKNELNLNCLEGKAGNSTIITTTATTMRSPREDVTEPGSMVHAKGAKVEVKDDKIVDYSS